MGKIFVVEWYIETPWSFEIISSKEDEGDFIVAVRDLTAQSVANAISENFLSSLSVEWKKSFKYVVKKINTFTEN